MPKQATPGVTESELNFTIAYPESGFVLPDSPAQLPRCRVNWLPGPQTTEESLAYAKSFGLIGELQAFADARAPAFIHVIDEKDQTLVFDTTIGGSRIHYKNGNLFQSIPGDILPLAEAAEIALEFLEMHNWLPSNEFELRPGRNTFFNQPTNLQTVRVAAVPFFQ